MEPRTRVKFLVQNGSGEWGFSHLICATGLFMLPHIRLTFIAPHHAPSWLRITCYKPWHFTHLASLKNELSHARDFSRQLKLSFHVTTAVLFFFLTLIIWVGFFSEIAYIPPPSLKQDTKLKSCFFLDYSRSLLWTFCHWCYGLQSLCRCLGLFTPHQMEWHLLRIWVHFLEVCLPVVLFVQFPYCPLPAVATSG